MKLLKSPDISLGKEPKVRMHLAGGILLFLSCMAIIIGCAAAKLPDVSTTPDTTYRLVQARHNITVAIDPYVQQERITRYFGKDLLRLYDILPVHVLIQNGEEAIIVEKSHITLTALSDNNLLLQLTSKSAKSPVEMKRLKVNETVDTAALIGALVPITAAPIILAAPFLDIYNRRSVEITANIARKSLTDRVLYAKETHSGFTYFYLGKTNETNLQGRMKIDLKTLKSEETYTYEFIVDNIARDRSGRKEDGS